MNTGKVMSGIDYFLRMARSMSTAALNLSSYSLVAL